jgi:hydrogenase/urease accessory protein HupE
MTKYKRVVLSLVTFVTLLASASVFAHAFDPGLLIIKHVDNKDWKIFWRKPDLNGTPMPIDIVLPTPCVSAGGKTTNLEAAAWISRWAVSCEQDAFSQPLRVSGLEQYDVNVVVRYWSAESDRYHTYLIQPDEPSVQFEDDSAPLSVFTTYLVLGFEHILEGWDHLLFLFALILLIQHQWKLVIAITAFTVAHSITLFASVTDIVRLNPQLVEALIAFSIVFLACEVAKNRSGIDSLSKQFPWLVTFTFGLLHGFGFAGALREIGIPQGEIPMTLFAFNVGVELGQLMFLLGVLSLMTLWRRLTGGLVRTSLITTRISAYFIGILSSYWLIERIVL